MNPVEKTQSTKAMGGDTPSRNTRSSGGSASKDDVRQRKPQKAKAEAVSKKSSTSSPKLASVGVVGVPKEDETKSVSKWHKMVIHSLCDPGGGGCGSDTVCIHFSGGSHRCRLLCHGCHDLCHLFGPHRHRRLCRCIAGLQTRSLRPLPSL